MITRRALLKGLAAVLAGSAAIGSYAFAIEPGWRLRVQRYALTPPQWPTDFRLRIAVVADLHACEPWVGQKRIRTIVDWTNELAPDITFLLGDYVAGHRFVTGRVPPEIWAAELARLAAPLGVHAILGNHDWWQDLTAQDQGHGPTLAHRALETAGIKVYENDAQRLSRNGRSFWVAGIGDQIALIPGKRWGRKSYVGVDDLPGTLSKITDTAPVILLVHEPDIFPSVPARVALTLAGHTHGGQVRLAGYSPIVPSRYGNRYAYGHVIEGTQSNAPEPDRHLIVSGGLGCSIMPVRFGVPPEIVVIDLGV